MTVPKSQKVEDRREHENLSFTNYKYNCLKTLDVFDVYDQKTEENSRLREGQVVGVTLLELVDYGYTGRETQDEIYRSGHLIGQYYSLKVWNLCFEEVTV